MYLQSNNFSAYLNTALDLNTARGHFIFGIHHRAAATRAHSLLDHPRVGGERFNRVALGRPQLLKSFSNYPTSH
jgi:hypothetical protein